MIVQEHIHGCGIACLAQLCKISYTEALTLLPNAEVRANNEGFYVEELSWALRSQGWNSYWIYMQPHFQKGWNKVNNIMFMPRSNLYPSGHYVVKTLEGWGNSYSNWPEWPPKAEIQKELPLLPEYVIINEIPTQG